MAQELNANSLCFILTPDGYEEITYSELCQRRDNDITYQDKKFLLLHGMLLEVAEVDYIDFHRNKRRVKYLKEQSEKRGDIYFSSLDSDEFNGEDMLVDDSETIADQLIHSMTMDKLQHSISLLSDEEQALIQDLFYNDMTERDVAAKHGVSQVAIHKRKKRILAKLKKIMN